MEMAIRPVCNTRRRSWHTTSIRSAQFWGDSVVAHDGGTEEMSPAIPRAQHSPAKMTPPSRINKASLGQAVVTPLSLVRAAVQ